MGFFGFGKSYSKEDLQREITKLQCLYRQAIGSDATNKSKSELKIELSNQLQTVLTVCRKGGFNGMETVEWSPTGPTRGWYSSLNSVTPAVQVLIEMM